MEIDFDAYLSGASYDDDERRLWTDVEVRRHEGDEWLVRASANGSRTDAPAIATELVRLWEGSLRYAYTAAHLVTKDSDAVTLRAITQMRPNGLWVTAEVQVHLT